MTELFGFVPKFYAALPESVLDDEWAVQRDFELGQTVLPNKVKELIGLAIAAHIKCGYCTYFNTKAARAFGATDDELREAVFMGGLTVQFSNAVTGAQVDVTQFRSDVDRAIAHMTARAPGAQPQIPRH
jgi:AhpD family alkylhydroperoxidase